MWKIQHPEGQREINELHVPVGENVRLTMTSEDVIHSFYVPAFRLKRDVLPGRYHTLWFQATKVGAYHLFCAEYCGTRHSGMIGTVYVMEPQAYEQWLGGASSGEAPEVAGRQLFESMRCRQGARARAPRRSMGCTGNCSENKCGWQVVANAVGNPEFFLETLLKKVASRGGLPSHPAVIRRAARQARCKSYRRYLKSVTGDASRPGGGAPQRGDRGEQLFPRSGVRVARRASSTPAFGRAHHGSIRARRT